jgi:hypothetical protein
MQRETGREARKWSTRPSRGMLLPSPEDLSNGGYVRLGNLVF